MNTLYPGLPDYTGPTKGLFTLLHHEGPLLEWSDDVMERIKFINEKKPKHERAIRLRHIVFFPKKLWGKKLQKAYAERKKADAEWEKAYAEREKAYAEWEKADAKWEKAYAEWEKADAEWEKADAKWKKADADKILTYLKKHVKDCKWDGSTLVFKE